MRYKSAILYILILLLLNFGLTNLINNYQSNYAIGYGEGTQELFSQEDQYIHQIFSSEDGYFTITSGFNITSFEALRNYTLEYSTLENEDQWSLRLDYNYSIPSILSVSERWVIIDVLSSRNSWFRGSTDPAYEKSFLLYDQQSSEIQKIMIPEIAQLVEYYRQSSNTTTYYSSTRYIGEIIQNNLVLVEYGQSGEFSPVHVFMFDLLNQVTINSYIIDPNEAALEKSPEIVATTDTTLSLLVATLESSIPEHFNFDMYEIDFKNNVITNNNIGEVICDIACIGYPLTSSNLVIIEVEAYDFPKKLRFAVGDLENQSRYYYNLNHTDIIFSIKRIQSDLLLMFGNTDPLGVAQPFVGFLRTSNGIYNITEFDLQITGGRLSYLHSLDLSSNDHILLAFNNFIRFNDTSSFYSEIVVLSPNPKPDIPFFIDFPNLPNITATIIITVVYVLLMKYFRNRRERMTAVLYPKNI
jgi:hypothetical protein